MAKDGAVWRREAGYLAELVGVTAVAVAQPVFDVIEQAPEELVNRGAGSREIVVFALAVVFGPPVIIWLVEQPFRLVSARAREVVHATALGLLVALFVVELVKGALGDDPRRWLWLLGAGVAVGAVLLFLRTQKPRSVLRYLALAAPAFLGLFLFASPVADLVVGRTVDPAEVAVENPVPVVLIVFDELPLVSLLDGEGGIDADSYPAFAELASGSTWFRNTTGVSPVTPSAVPAIFTGQLPDQTFPAPVSTRFDESVFTLLGGSYDAHSVETLTQICPSTICETTDEQSSGQSLRSLFRLGREVFRSLADPGEEATNLAFVIEENPSDPLAPQRFREFSTRVAAGDGATLDVGHFLLPHQPWNYLASGRTYTAPDPPRSAEFGSWHDQITADEGRQRHLTQLQYTDLLLGRAIERLQATGRWDESLVIVTADHGAAFVGGEPLRGVSAENYPQVMWTPLFVKVPDQTEGDVDDRATETIDVVPTIADVTGAEIPWEVDGTSVFEPAPDDRPARMYTWRFNEAEPDEDGFVTFDRPAGFDEVLGSDPPLAGAAGDRFALYRLGEFADLVGRPVADLEVGEPAPFDMTTRATAEFTVPEGATDVSAYLEGIWEGEPEGWVTVAIDGTLAGIGKTYLQGEFATAWMMLAEHLFTPGDHELAVYSITGSPEAPVLHPVGLVPWEA